MIDKSVRQREVERGFRRKTIENVFRKEFLEQRPDDDYTNLKPAKIQMRYTDEVVNSFLGILEPEYKKYFIQLDPGSDPSELNSAILGFYFENIPSDEKFRDWMAMALKWKCPKIAVRYFFNQSVKSTEDLEYLRGLLVEAVATNQVEFVKLFVTMGVDFRVKKEAKSPEKNSKEVFDVRQFGQSHNLFQDFTF